jgi:hypothetical protein
MSYTKKVPSTSLDMFRVSPIMGFTMQQVAHWISWDSHIQIGLAIVHIASPPSSVLSVWDLAPSVG